MKRNKNQFPGIPRTKNVSTSESAITENVEILTGVRGTNRALLLSDLINLDDLKRKALINSAKGDNSGGLPIVPGGGIEKPHAPVNLKGTGGFTFIALTWDHPTYKGHAYAEIFRSETNVFSDAIRISTEVSDIFSDNVNMGVGYYYWVRFVNKADQIGPTQGANGLYVKTQKSAELILNEIGGMIESSHLGDFLKTEVDKIPELSLAIPILQFTIPDLELNMYDPSGLVQTAKDNATEAKSNTEAMATNLANAVLENDAKWQDNATKLIEINASLNNVKSTVEESFYTRAEANEAIAAAATTLQTEIEESLGIAISSDLENTFYTKATADEAIALADLALKAAIEDPLGNSIGATLNNDYYTSADADNAIAAAGTALVTAIEDPLGNSIGATLNNDYYTKTTTNEALSAFGVLLKSDIENPEGESLGAELQLNYYTKSNTDRVVALSIEKLNSTFDVIANSVIENAIANDLALEQQRIATADIIKQQQTSANEEKSLADSVLALETQFNESKSSATKLTESLATNVNSSARDLVQLKSQINNVSADLEQNYYTAVSADQAMSSATTILKAAIEDPLGNSIGADLQQNYYTKATANSAISNATTQLKTAIEDTEGNSIGADLFHNYYTAVSADQAISVANTILKAAIEDPLGNSIGAALQTLSETVATNDEQWAMWGVKATVRDITASFGLVNDGEDPIFAIKGAKFAIITDQDPNNLTPVFSVVGNQTVIESALIDQAFIQSLVTDDLLSNRVVIGSELQTPSINYNKNTGARSQNFSLSPNGIMHARAALLESVVIHDANGNIIMSSSGAINSNYISGLGSLAFRNDVTLSNVSGAGPFAGLQKILSSNITTYIESGAIGSAQIDQAFINELFGVNASFLGKVYAEKIEGDLVDGDITSVSASASTVTGDWVTIKTLTISRSNKFDAWLAIDDIVPSFDKNSGFGVLYTRLKYGSSTGKAVAIYKGSSSVSVSIQVKAVEVPIAETPVDVYVPYQNVALNMFRKGSGFIN